MYARQPLPPEVAPLALRQASVVSRAQLVRLGLRDSQVARLTRQEVLHCCDRGLYLYGATEAKWPQYAWAGVLLGGPRARLLGSSAGAVEGLCPPRTPVLVGVPLRSDPGNRRWVRFVRESPDARSPARTGGPPRTPVEDTVLDLCGAAASEGEVVDYLLRASQRLTTAARMRAALSRRSRIRHRRLIEDVLGEVRRGARSALELRWIRDVERPHGLPTPERPYTVSTGKVADGGYREFRVLLELDGRQYHEDEPFRDWRRDNVHSEDDWLTVRYGWHDTVGDCCGVAGNLARVLTRRGWSGSLLRCPRCPA
ncbi:MAG: hypothetical protein ACLGIF_09325 [Actinomycetes bacterium]